MARGTRRIVVGTRAAAFAPVHDLGLAAIWDDGDDLHAEPRAPYPHAREVLLTRAQVDAAAQRGFGAGMSSGYAGSAAEQAVVNALLAGETGRPADSFGALGSMLYGPVVQAGGS